MRSLRLFVLWVIFCTTSFVLALGLGIASFFLLLNLTNCETGRNVTRQAFCISFDYIAMALASAFGGAIIGFVQWVVLRLERILSNGWWIVASSLGWSAGVVIGLGVINLGNMVQSVVAYGFIGALVGFSQYIVLRRYLDKAIWWIPANMISLAVIGLASKGNSSDLFAWSLLGVITGAILVWVGNESSQHKVETAGS